MNLQLLLYKIQCSGVDLLAGGSPGLMAGSATGAHGGKDFGGPIGPGGSLKGLWAANLGQS